MKPVSVEGRQSRQRVQAPASFRVDELSAVATLTNGRYSVRLNGAGCGFSVVAGAAITRSSGNALGDSGGFHIYLRDLDEQLVWSTGYQPTQVRPFKYEFRADEGRVLIHRADHGIDCRLTVSVSPVDDFEVRRCELTNFGEDARRIEITSYLEWVLGSTEADAGHPAFSKLFVETSFCSRRNAISASRRPRSSDERSLWGFHSLVGDDSPGTLAATEFETNRLRFIGRGRTSRRPAALQPGAQLSGDFGPVLDPVAALRHTVLLEPGATRAVTFVLGAAQSREYMDHLLETATSPDWLHELLVPDPGFTSENGFDDGSAAYQSNGGAGDEHIVLHSAHDEFAKVIGDGRDAGFRPADLGRERLSARIDGSLQAASDLRFDNGYGGFSADGREYVIRVEPDGEGGQRRPPLPWANVIANERIGFLVTESGAGYTWAGNSRLNRLTAWHNDPVTDPHSEALWIRDEDAGVFWSPTPGPTPAATEYTVRHGFGYTVFELESSGLRQEVTTFVCRDEPVKLTRVRINNQSGRPRRLSLFSYAHWLLGGLASETSAHVVTADDAENQVLWATNPAREQYGQCAAFSAVRFDDDRAVRKVSRTCDRAGFLGANGDPTAPQAIAAGGELDGAAGSGLDACAAWKATIDLPAGSSFECTVLLGEAADRASALELINNYSSPQQVEAALLKVGEFWRETLSGITIETPDPEIDLMVNGWLLYQNLSCRVWGRSAYYQPGGAFGFRDQLQDSAAFVYHRPEITRTQILQHAGQQFAEGDVLHWWHPDSGWGLRTRFSDDLLWLPYIAAEYVSKTGDEPLLDQILPFLEGPPLKSDQHEVYLRPVPSMVTANVYEHCCRALDRGLTVGKHNLPLIGSGDWNDGFSRVGRLGRGESVWLGFFIDHVLERFLPLCRSRKDDERVARYTKYREQLREALNTAGWDGGWYRRAYYDNGQPMGSASSDECQIDAIAQAWAVLSKVASAERAAMAMLAVETRLVDDRAGMIKLLTPPFNRTPNDPGYIKGYLPGIRENGGQYTHGVLWVIRAMAEMGCGTRAVDLLRMLSPVWHAATRERAEVYQTEPYVVAADVYAEPPHVGRGGWTWYTGSAGWMYRVAVESIFGLSLEGGQVLVLDPCLSSDWPRATMRYRLPDGKTTYVVTIENPDRGERGIASATVDGASLPLENEVARVPLEFDGREHHVSLRLGPLDGWFGQSGGRSDFGG